MPESLQETASVLLAIASGENLPKKQQGGAPRAGGDDDESLDPQQLLLHLQVRSRLSASRVVTGLLKVPVFCVCMCVCPLMQCAWPVCLKQTHPPEEDSERRGGARAQKRSAASSENDSGSERDESDEGGTEEQRQRRRKSMSMLGKQDRMAKGLAPKRGKIAKAAKVSGSGGGGLVRVRRSSLFKALSEPGRAIGVKDAVDKDKGSEDGVGGAGGAGGDKDAAPPSPTALPPSSAASKRPAKERESKGEARSKKSHVEPPVSASAQVAGSSSKRRDVHDSDATVDIAVIVKLARALTDLADRIPYMGVHTSTPKVWSDFNDILAKVTSVAGIRKQWLWLTEQVCQRCERVDLRGERVDLWQMHALAALGLW